MTAEENLPITIENSDGTTVLKPSGDVDLSGAPELRARIAEVFSDPPARLVIDLSEVPYMDSSGVATLVEGMQLANHAGATLVLAGMQDRVKSIFEIARLDTVFKIAEDLTAAKEL
ncbi:MAG: STAS domain-containing protein [Planctomycetota bacterium]|nr:STAS domain-containing protein [Planctomycetota bacterium]